MINPSQERILLTVKEMTCQNCAFKIEGTLKNLRGIEAVKADYAGNSVEALYDPSRITKTQLVEEVENLGYPVVHFKKLPLSGGTGSSNPLTKIKSLLMLTAVFLAGYLILQNQEIFYLFPEVDQSMGYGLIFAAGILTSFHCIAMCGGINLSQSVTYRHRSGGFLEKLKPSLLYNTGRVMSYTLLGGIVGAVGSVISFTVGTKGLISVAAGLFLLLMGINMLNLFQGLRRFLPQLPKPLKQFLFEGQSKNGPYYIGLLNGLMPCGPLQAMQLYALGTGSFTEGALSMLLFSLGTVPLMFLFGALSSLISAGFSKKMQLISGITVMLLGLIMVNRGLALYGIATLPSAAEDPVPGVTRIVGEEQIVEFNVNPYYFERLVFQKGIPVRMNIHAKEGMLTGCNNAILIPAFNIQKNLQLGDNWIEFTPEEEGTFIYSCWMGMIRSDIQVVADLKAVTQE